MNEKPIRVLIIARDPTVLEHMQSLLQQCDVESVITTSDDEAVRRLEAVEVSAVVIGGGVPELSRQQIYAVATCHGVPVVAGALRGKDPATYVREELLPALRSAVTQSDSD
jgi:DNA-binding NarL/FixJ family response regulator